MFYKSSDNLISALRSLPETAMGYQIVNLDTYRTKRTVVFINSYFGFDLDDTFGAIEYKNATPIDIDIDFSNIVIDANIGAVDGKEEAASGSDIQKFVRLSAFENDFRVDTQLKCLLPGSFTTDLEDYLTLNINNYNPLVRYALPNPLPIQYLFYFKSQTGDIFQRGICQPKFNHQGGGREYFFKNGTAVDTLISINKFK